MKYQAGIAALVKNGLSSTQAQKMAKTIDANFGQWQREVKEGKRVYAKKNAKEQPRTIEMNKEGNRVFVHLKSKSGGRVGKGSFGKVTKTIDFTTGKLFVQKNVIKHEKKGTALLKSAEEIAERREALKQEGELHLLFKDCANVVQVEHVGDQSILLEHMNGGSLKSYLLKHAGELSSEQLRSIGQQMIAAVEQLHEKGFVHNDLKFDNFLVNIEPDGKITVKVADLGIARRIDKKGVAGGTNRFFSPAKLNRYLDDKLGLPQRAQSLAYDTFALGTLLFELHYGQEPSFNHKAYRIYAQIEQISELKNELKGLIKGNKPLKNRLLELVRQGNDKLSEADLEPFRTGVEPAKWQAFVEMAQSLASKVKAARTNLVELKQQVQSFYDTEPPQNSEDHLIWKLWNSELSAQEAQATLALIPIEGTSNQQIANNVLLSKMFGL